MGETIGYSSCCMTLSGQDGVSCLMIYDVFRTCLGMSPSSQAQASRSGMLDLALIRRGF